MSENSLLCIGEVMVELSLSPERPDSAGISLAGDTLNTANYLRRAEPELRVAYAIKLGTDELSDRIVAMMQPPGLERDALDAFDLVYLSAITLAILPSDDRATLIGWLRDYRAGGGRSPLTRTIGQSFGLTTKPPEKTWRRPGALPISPCRGWATR